MAREPPSYKERKEAFVSNLSGSTLNEINLVTVVAAAALLLWTALQKRRSFFTPYTPLAFAADFLLNVCAILFAFTIYSSAPLLLTVSLVTPAVLLLVLSPSTDEPRQRPLSSSSSAKSKTKATTTTSTPTIPQQQPFLPVRPFLTHYRGSMLVATTVAILAVDFPVFPRRYAKVETWGTSMMDLGVGSFVFSGGIVSARTLLKPPSSSRPFVHRFVASFRHSIPLIVLGLIRLWSVKGLDYAEHVTEYGVHWNFFFTLGLLAPFVELSDLVTQTVLRHHDVTAVVIAVAYEIALGTTGLLRFILTAPRVDLLSKNREGIFSFIGYLAVFLAGRGTGRDIIVFTPPAGHASGSSSKQARTSSSAPPDPVAAERLATLRTLLTRAVVYAGLFLLCTHYYTLNLRVSRRLANLPYVLWVVSFNNAQIALFGFIEHLGPSFSYPFLSSSSSSSSTASTSPDTATSRVMKAFNTNGLPLFLVANLGTGLVNLSVDTLDADALRALAILLVYMGAVTGVAVGMQHYGVRIRL